MDTIQTGCIVTLSYQYLIFNFTRPEIHDHIFPHVSITPLLLNGADTSRGYIGQLWYVVAANMHRGSSSLKSTGFPPTYSESR